MSWVTDIRFKVGSKVRVMPDAIAEQGLKVAALVTPDETWPEAEIVYHGRASGGIYTRVRFADGHEDEYHRAWLFQERP